MGLVNKNEVISSRLLKRSNITQELIDECEMSLKILEHLSAQEKKKDEKLKNMTWRIRQHQFHI